MNINLVGELLDACFYCKQITELMPVLPTGIKRRHIHVLHAINILEKKVRCVSAMSVKFCGSRHQVLQNS